MTEPPSNTDVRPPTRIAALDALRGVAVLGIAFENILLVAHSRLVWELPQPPWDGALDQTLNFLLRWLEEGKLYSLFSLIFGMSFGLQIVAERERIGPIIRRLALLLVIGLAHGLFIWWGDILTAYAVLGFALLVFRTTRRRGLLSAAGILYGVNVALPVLALLIVVTLAVSRGGDGALRRSDARAQAETRARFEQDTAIFAHGDWAAIQQRRVDEFGRSLLGAATASLNIFIMFLLGLYAARAQLLDDASTSRRVREWLVRIALPVGLVLHGVHAYATATRRETLMMNEAMRYVVFIVGLPFLTMGYAALAMTLFYRVRSIAGLFAPVGRMSLTNYIGQSLIFTTLFYGYGLGLHGRLALHELLALAAGVGAAQIVVSHLWLKTFALGPLEWLWRAGVYLRLPPVRPSTSPP